MIYVEDVDFNTNKLAQKFIYKNLHLMSPDFIDLNLPKKFNGIFLDLKNLSTSDFLFKHYLKFKKHYDVFSEKSFNENYCAEFFNNIFHLITSNNNNCNYMYNYYIYEFLSLCHQSTNKKTYIDFYINNVLIENLKWIFIDKQNMNNFGEFNTEKIINLLKDKKSINGNKIIEFLLFNLY